MLTFTEYCNRFQLIQDVLLQIIESINDDDLVGKGLNDYLEFDPKVAAAFNAAINTDLGNILVNQVSATLEGVKDTKTGEELNSENPNHRTQIENEVRLAWSKTIADNRAAILAAGSPQKPQGTNKPYYGTQGTSLGADITDPRVGTRITDPKIIAQIKATQGIAQIGSS